jgi:2-haloacid dehalogenase
VARRHLTAVVFDVGGVLLDWDPRHLYRQVLPSEDEVERFLGEVCTWEWHTQHDQGRPMAETIPELVARHPQHAEAIALWSSRYHDMIAGEIAGMVELLHDLRDHGLRLFVLSNMPADVLHVFETFRWFDLFDGLVFSGLEGVSKPDAAIYRLLIDRHAVDPKTTAFVDDREENVAAAAALGFDVVHFRDAEQLRMALLEVE